MSRRQFAVVLVGMVVIIGLELWLAFLIRKVDKNAQDAEELAGEANDRAFQIQQAVDSIEARGH